MRDKLWVMTEQQSQNLLLKVDPLSTIRNNKFITQGEKLETVIVKVRGLVSNILSPPLKRWYKRYEFSYFFVGGLHVFNKNFKVYTCIYMHVIKKHRNNLLFSYYELGFRCFELNLFSHYFDLTGRKDSIFTRNLLDLNKCLKCMLFTLPHQTAAS